MQPHRPEGLRDHRRPDEARSRALRPKCYMMGHDEIRIGGWTPDYAGKTCGECARQEREEVRTISSRSTRPAPRSSSGTTCSTRTTTRSAQAYYLVKSTWAGSWEGLPKDVVVMDWLVGDGRRELRASSTAAATRADDGRLLRRRPRRQREEWVEAAKASKAKVIGIMYTTWRKLQGPREVHRSGGAVFSVGASGEWGPCPFERGG